MLKKKSHAYRAGSSRPLTVTAYLVTTFFILLILFPLFLITGYAMRDNTALNENPSALLPERAKSVELVLDYTDYAALEEQRLLDLMQRDALYAMYTSSAKFDGKAIGEYKLYGMIDGKTVFYQRQHNMALRIQLDYGAYMGVTRFDRETLTGTDRYQKALQAADYSFDLSGLSIQPTATGADVEQLGAQLTAHLTARENGSWLEGKIQSVSIRHNLLLLFENFYYYFEIPKYMYATVPAIADYSLLAFLFNTVMVMLWAVLTQIGLCSTSAYALSRLFSRRMSKILMMFFLVTMMIPFICILLPQMLMMKQLGAMNNYAAMLLPYLYPAAFYIFLFKGFFDRLPQDLLDAAKMDGASQFYIFTRICMPLSKSITALLVLNVIVSAWNDFFWYLSAANRTNLWTINLALYSISTNPMTKTNVSMGIAFMTILPVILLTLIFQRQIKESVISSGIKG